MPYLKAFKLTQEQAVFIKTLRMDGYTWRAIARDVAHKYPELKVFPGNQIDGADLCEAALLLLGENIEDGWN